MTYWTKSTTAQKLVQINGAIECGMTATQCAMNLRTTKGAILGFMNKHGLSYASSKETIRAAQSRAGKKYGAHIGLNNLKRYADKTGYNVANSPTARIFPADGPDKLFDDHPLDEA